MPYSKWSEVNDSIKGIDPQVTLGQANSIARCADTVEDVDSPWAVCIANFKRSHRVEGEKWVKKDAEAQQYGGIFSIAEFAAGEEDLLTVQIMQPCSTIEKHGRPVTITEDDEEVYAANFTAGKALQEVPIHIGHPSNKDKASQPAAAWYKRVYTRVVDGVKTVWADLELSSVGRKALTEKLYKHFSPALDLENKVIVGGAFMNYPAIRGMAPIEMAQFLIPDDDDETITGRLATVLKALKVLGDYLKPENWSERNFMEQLIAAVQSVTWLAGAQQSAEEETGVEMSARLREHLFGSQEDTMTAKELAELTAKIRAEEVAKLAAQQVELEAQQTAQAELEAGLRKKIQAELEVQMVETARARAELAEFVSEVTTGEAALSTPPEDLTAFLVGLTPEQLEVAQAILKTKVADLSELGHTGNDDGLKPLAAEAKAGLDAHLAQGGELQDFIDGNPELKGSDFSAYQTAE
jgi:hypothetical protein